MPAETVLETAVREEWGRLMSLLLARYRRLDLVEDALGDAVEAAAGRWPTDGAPDKPAAWLLTTARRRVIDRLRAESMAQRKAPLLVTEAEHRQDGQTARADPGGLVEDDLLRLVLMCTHPALAPEAASALALRLVLGVSTHDIARLFLDLCPSESAPLALLALTLLQHSRRDARVGDDGRLVLLADQDRRLWRRDEIDEALSLLASPVLAGPISPLAASYVVQARIAAEHATAGSPEETGWPRIVEQYDVLLALFPSPSARLARAVAVAEASGPEAGLAALDEVEMPGSHRVAAVRAELLSRRGHTAAARVAYDEAIATCRNDVERAHLVERRSALVGDGPA